MEISLAGAIHEPRQGQTPLWINLWKLTATPLTGPKPLGVWEPERFVISAEATRVLVRAWGRVKACPNRGDVAWAPVEAFAQPLVFPQELEVEMVEEVRVEV